MLIQLRAARADNTHDKKMLRFTSPDRLIIDDLGLRARLGDEPLDLYVIIRSRYERGSTVITSNRALTEWTMLFKDEILASAAMDGLLHDSHVVEIVGKSYRNPPGDGGHRQAA